LFPARTHPHPLKGARGCRALGTESLFGRDCLLAFIAIRLAEPDAQHFPSGRFSEG
jgi:hypothetical protein